MADEQTAGSALKPPPHVRQALNELDNGIRTGNEESVRAARKRLNAAGEDGEAAEAAGRKRYADGESQEAKRAAAAERRGALQAQVDATKADAGASGPPVGRSTKPHATT